MVFQQVQPAPPDAILGLTEAYKADPRPGKINLGVGVYKDARGVTPVLESVRAAEQRLLAGPGDKSYLPIDGDAEYGRLIRDLAFGIEHPVLAAGRALTAHTPGGTGALRVAADYLKRQHPDLTVHMPDPTWANHGQIFPAAGMQTGKYAYFDREGLRVDLDGMLDSLRQVPAGDAVLLHGCCHNPTGADPSADAWRQIADVLADRGLLPVVDLAYQGFGDGLDDDAQGLRTLADAVPEMLVCTSYSKNFSLYNERVGALTVVATDADAAGAVHSHVKKAIRANYSNPPAHGAAIVRTILSDADLTAQWQTELAGMRQRINTMRQQFADTLKAVGGPDWPFITRQRGMFSLTPLTPEQVDRLREDHAVYAVRSGRINVAGMSEDTMEPLCKAVARVVG